MLRVSLFFAPLFALFILNASAQDDISVREGRFEVFYSVLNTSFLKPDVAAAAGIIRAKNRGMINVSVLEHFTESGTINTRPADLESVSAVLFDLVHSRDIELKEINEPNARYYIGDFKISNDNERMIFRVAVKPAGSELIKVEFQRHLYID